MFGIGLPELVVLLIIVLAVVGFFTVRGKKKNLNQTIANQTDMDKATRPSSVTYLVCFICALTLIMIFSSLTALNKLQRPDTTSVIITELIFTVISLVLAVGLFYGRNLARWLWVFFGLVYFLIDTLAVEKGRGPGFYNDLYKLLWIISLFVLFKPKAKAYFRNSSKIMK
jgi:hypothetical protein